MKPAVERSDLRVFAGWTKEAWPWREPIYNEVTDADLATIGFVALEQVKVHLGVAVDAGYIHYSEADRIYARLAAVEHTDTP